MGKSLAKRSKNRVGSNQSLSKEEELQRIAAYAEAVAGTKDDLDPALEAASITALLNADDDQ